MSDGSDSTMIGMSKNGPWWVKLVTYWGLPGAIIIFLFWKDVRQGNEKREDDKSVLEVIQKNTQVMTEFNGTIREFKEVMKENTETRRRRN